MAGPRTRWIVRAACWPIVLCAALGLGSCRRTEPNASAGRSSGVEPKAGVDATATTMPVPDASPAQADPAAQVAGESDSPVPREANDREFVSPLAGTWYDADRQTLIDEIDGYLARVAGEPLDDVCALILPHAGYRYSGPTAAYGLHQVRGRTFQRIVVLGPSHRVLLENVASVPDFTHYITPLGRVPLDVQFLAELRRYQEFQNIPHAHEGEHSVQIELPLLQRALGEFQFVPIVVGQLDRAAARRMGRILRGLIDPQTLVVASSDFTHYGANYGYVPFTEDVPANLKKLDDGAIDQVCQKSVDGLFDYVDRTGATICGRCAIGVLLSMLPEDAQVHPLHYETSGQMVGDYANSVSYCALAVTGAWRPVAAAASPPGLPAEEQGKNPPGAGGARSAASRPRLSAEEQCRLLKLARGSLSYVLRHGEMPTAEQLEVEITPAMAQISGAFVTLRKGGELRGCIGEIFPCRPLYRNVMTQAVNAGLNDYRFAQVESAELEEIDFEISILTPPRNVPSADAIEVGRHGVVLKKGGSSSVFLPKVAVEQGWNLETMLAQLSRKAGLPADAWRDGATFEVFEAIVLGEKQEATE